MVGELGRICANFSVETLEALASVHLRDAIEMLKEASEYCISNEATRHPGLSWSIMAN